jgi:hypothetical protein
VNAPRSCGYDATTWTFFNGAGLAGLTWAAGAGLGGGGAAAAELPDRRAAAGGDSHDATASTRTGTRIPARIAVVVRTSGWGGGETGGNGTRRLYPGSRACRL